MSSAGTDSRRMTSELVDSILGNFGGTGRMGERTADLLDDISDRDSENYSPKAATELILKFMGIVAQRDKISQDDERIALTDEEIEQQLRVAAMEWIATDPAFRMECFQMSIRRDPDLIRVAVESADDIEEIHASIARRNQRIPSASEIRQQREEERQRLLTSGEYEVVDVDTVEDAEEHEALEEEFGIGGVG